MSNGIINGFIVLSKKFFKIYLGISISVFLFILFFQPFSAINFEFENKLLFIAGFGMIIFLIQVIVQILFQKYLAQDRTDREENLIINPLYYFSLVAFASVAFAFYIRYVGHTTITFNLMLRVIIICLSIPVSIYLKNSIASIHDKYKNLLQENRVIQEKLKQFSESYTNRFIELNSDSDSENFKIQVSDLVFVKSADNYVEVGYREGDELKKKMIRNTLKSVEKQLKDFNNFVRTHRTSIVNIQFIDKLNKNFNTYWLTLDETKEIIPVSRQYLMAVKDLF